MGIPSDLEPRLSVRGRPGEGGEAADGELHGAEAGERARVALRKGPAGGKRRRKTRMKRASAMRYCQCR